MGQVWSKADFDGMDNMGFQGGRGSCLAVTAQYVGEDGQWFTSDDIYEADLNVEPGFISADMSTGDGAFDSNDRVRPFMSRHPGGANFGLVDGSVQFVRESVDRKVYIVRSQIASGTVVNED